MSHSDPRRPDPASVRLDDIVRLRKVHPCGADTWCVVRLGAEIGLRCTGCGRKVLASRSEFAKGLKAFVEPAAAVDVSGDAGSIVA